MIVDFDIGFLISDLGFLHLHECGSHKLFQCCLFLTNGYSFLVRIEHFYHNLVVIKLLFLQMLLQNHIYCLCSRDFTFEHTYISTADRYIGFSVIVLQIVDLEHRNVLDKLMLCLLQVNPLMGRLVALENVRCFSFVQNNRCCRQFTSHLNQALLVLLSMYQYLDGFFVMLFTSYI